MFRKILIANRGEIAVRVERTCREMGIVTVAVYSDADRDGLHVRYADEARRIGPASSAESYLRMEAVLEAARETGADGIHPGYGFLAENADFARRCGEEGLVFVGPPPEALALMGDKVAARRIAREAGVPVVPGTEVALSDEAAIKEAETIGYPLVVKAAAGGGGKGMRVVSSPEELEPALRQARSEASASFGDASVYLERYLCRPRHIEFQIVADGMGSVLHLLERECSIQRRYQKLIEECPSPFLDSALRARMGAAAVAVARRCGYRNAGTVEFLVDGEGRFYFLEMNARLQVEHPVTEMVTGLDLVKLQLEIASGRGLGLDQGDIEPRGWAMELRITAEDPFQDFLPSSGRIRFLRPAGGLGVRDDSGVYAGGEVTPHYDPLIAKLIVWDSDRERCLARARRAVREYRVEGIATTLPFFHRMLRDPQFVAGEMDVGFVDRNWRGGGGSLPGRALEGDNGQAAVIAAAVAGYRARARPAESKLSRGSAWKQEGLREQLRGRL
ncbi:MAG: acetyl/propionyl/methylcrotonyl-CoA carboxylase subunit alpha [Acidobacteriota bacterium]